MGVDVSDGVARGERGGANLAQEGLLHRARKVASHVADVIDELNRGAPCDLEAHADFVDAAYAILFPEPWLAFVECIHLAVLECGGATAARQERHAESWDWSGDPALDAARLARRYFEGACPDLAERAWPRLEPRTNWPPLLAAVTAWIEPGGDSRRWEALREAIRCFHPEVSAPWESMDRQWRKHARHKFLPPRPKADPRVADVEP